MSGTKTGEYRCASRAVVAVCRFTWHGRAPCYSFACKPASPPPCCGKPSAWSITDESSIRSPTSSTFRTLPRRSYTEVGSKSAILRAVLAGPVPRPSQGPQVAGMPIVGRARRGEVLGVTLSKTSAVHGQEQESHAGQVDNSMLCNPAYLPSPQTTLDDMVWGAHRAFEQSRVDHTLRRRAQTEGEGCRRQPLSSSVAIC